MEATVAVIGTCDTKLTELLFLRDEIEKNAGTNAILIDVGNKPTPNDNIYLSASDILSKYSPGVDISQLTRGEFIERMSDCTAKAVQELYANDSIHGIISAGGSGGTALASTVMRLALPIGFPKLIVSTIASGDTGPIIGETDITLMYSVVDIAGLNQLLRGILGNAAAAIAAAAKSYANREIIQRDKFNSKKRVAITMFGVTTPGVNAIRDYLESNFPIETYVFHATGHGGKAMERLIRNNQIDAVIDLTTTEICDLVMGGVMSAGNERLDAATAAGIPNIVSLGALDMANFGSKSSVPEKYKNRTQVQHNPIVTLVRSSADDCKAVAEFICQKLKKSVNTTLTQVWVPKGGISMLAVPGGPFYDEAADAILFGTINTMLEGTGIKVVEDPGHINDLEFARRVAKALLQLMQFSE
ncbi:hypothetical protein VFPPC_09921 [Pochonia chlamydosporia 170]|uniref:Uncharacterized protein n=1 Tax=Pochonia chlamydosporia 170 TaxID=1380566 RepID=A0A179F302_METCM|nr:hypothetical protein VFPPC_09921 [Pochonia chlamydosporia 170]OAQ59808.1 hypothetical protein VFPPC_09921 [Pochonia chlamydosporia 170]